MGQLISKEEADNNEEMNFIQAEVYILGRMVGGKIAYSDKNTAGLHQAVTGAEVPFGTYLEVAVDNLLANIRKEVHKVIRSKYGA